MNKEEIYLLFAPKSNRSLRFDYPELADYSEFKALNKLDLLFVWYYACRSSPYFNDDSRERVIIEKCARAAGLVFNEEDKKEKFFSGNFSDKIQAAINVMLKFEPSARIIARAQAMKNYNDIMKMTSLKLTDTGDHPSFLDKDGNIKVTDKKAYMSMVFDANQKTGDMLAKIEQGFGITQKSKTIIDKNKTGEGETFAEAFHNNE
jgi:hypothetical protein